MTDFDKWCNGIWDRGRQTAKSLCAAVTFIYFSGSVCEIAVLVRPRLLEKRKYRLPWKGNEPSLWHPAPNSFCSMTGPSQIEKNDWICTIKQIGYTIWLFDLLSRQHLITKWHMDSFYRNKQYLSNDLLQMYTFLCRYVYYLYDFFILILSCSRYHPKIRIVYSHICELWIRICMINI